MQDVALRAGGRTPLRRIATLDVSLRDRECSSVVIRKYPIGPSSSLFSSSCRFCSSSSSLFSRGPLHPCLVHLKWRNGAARVSIMPDDRVSMFELDELDVIRKYSIAPRPSLLSSSSHASSDSCSRCPWHPSLVYPKWRTVTTRVLCMRDDRESVPESNKPEEVVLKETLDQIRV